ncbi:MAG: VOC family protein [Blastocatellia bacterium]
MIGVQPYLNFNGNCEEAINFYKDALGGEILFMQHYGESPMAGMSGDDKVMHCTLKIGDTHIMASDNPENMPATAGSNISLAIGMNDVDKAKTYFANLSDGGNVTMPLDKTFWAEAFGMLTDKFGINWMVNCDAPQDADKSAAA